METRVASQESSPRDLQGRPNDQWLQAIFGQAAVGIAVIDGEGHFLHCNQKLAQITGRDVAELIGLQCSEVTHPDDWPASQTLMEDLRRGVRSEFSAEKRYLRPDGAVVWVNVAVSPLRDTTGRYDRLIAVIEDITARKRAEHAVQESERRLRRVLERMPAGAYLCDRNGLITYYNQQAEQLWGRAPKLNDPIDRYCGSFKLYASDGTPIKHSECWMALALREETAYDGREIIVERPDGQRMTVLAHASPIWDDDDELDGGGQRAGRYLGPQAGRRVPARERGPLPQPGRQRAGADLAGRTRRLRVRQPGIPQVRRVRFQPAAGDHLAGPSPSRRCPWISHCV